MPTMHKNLALLRVADVRVFDEIRAVYPLDEVIVGWLSPTEAVLDPHRMRALIETLEQRGLGALVRRAGAPT